MNGEFLKRKHKGAALIQWFPLLPRTIDRSVGVRKVDSFMFTWKNLLETKGSSSGFMRELPKPVLHSVSQSHKADLL